MTTSKRKGQFYRSLNAMCVLPLLISGLVITFFCYQTVASAMHSEVKTELKNIVDSVILTYDLLYPGDYRLVDTEAYEFVKGDRVLNGDFTIIDRLKEKTDAEITIFYKDTRVLTTIFNNSNVRIIGTGANSRVKDDVLLTGQAHFYTNTTINEEEYFAYYAPLFNSDNSVVGMVYAGKPRATVNKAVRMAIYPITLIALCSMLIISLITSSYAHKLSTAIQKICTFLSKISTGNLTAELDGEVLRRGDELSEMGYSALYMQCSIRTLVEQDTLTELNNRRSADKRLKQTQMQANIHGTHFVVSIGDIDLFKSVNDTFGHECGDVVLKQVAATLKRHMLGKGFVARWGGEEFLFVYDNLEMEEAKKETQALLEKLRTLAIPYEQDTIHITMTFGLAEGGVNSNIKELLQVADLNLYKGKNSGRNCIIG